MPRPGSRPAIPMHRRAAAPAAERSSEPAADTADGLRAQAFAGAPVGLGVIDRTHRLIEANPALQELLGDRASNGARLADLVADDSADAVTGVLDALRQGNSGQRVCVHAVAAAGKQPLVLTLSPLTVADGRQHVLSWSNRTNGGPPGTPRAIGSRHWAAAPSAGADKPH